MVRRSVSESLQTICLTMQPTLALDAIDPRRAQLGDMPWVFAEKLKRAAGKGAAQQVQVRRQQRLRSGAQRLLADDAANPADQLAVPAGAKRQSAGLSRAISRSSTRPPVIPIGPSDRLTEPSVERGIGWVDHIPIPAVSRAFSATLSDRLERRHRLVSVKGAAGRRPAPVRLRWPARWTASSVQRPSLSNSDTPAVLRVTPSGVGQPRRA